VTARRPFLVGIAGGSGSGKTTLASGLAEALGADRTSILAHDAYYRDQAHLAPEARAALDYDVPDVLDGARFLADLRRLRTGRRVCPPHYCFVTHRRLGGGRPVEPREIVIAEGILLFHDPAVCAALDLRIFVDAPAALRRQRRLARDVSERGRTAESVLRQITTTVEPAHVAYVEPTKVLAHLILLNTGPAACLVEIAATVVRTHLARRTRNVAGVSAAEEFIGARRKLA
jgi:uridine kinase